MIHLNGNQITCVTWLSNAKGDFISNICKLEGGYKSIPDDVIEAFNKLNNKQKSVVVYKSAEIIVKGY